MLNSYFPGEDQLPADNDNPQGWNYSQDLYGYNLGNQFMNDLRSKFYWDQDTKSWKALPGTSGTSAGVGVPKIGTKEVASKATTPVGTPGASVGSSTSVGTTGASVGTGGNSMAAAAGIQAGAQLGGSYMAGKGAKDAARIQAQSAREALQFAREQEAGAQGRYGQSKQQYDQQVADWYAARNALLSRYGVDINLGAGGVPPGGFPALPRIGVPQEGQNVVNVGGAPRTTPGNVRHPSPSSPGQRSATLGDLATNSPEWNDWARYNLGRNA